MSIFKKLTHLPILFAGVAMGLGVFINVNTSKNAESVSASTPVSTYYSSVSGTGTTLLNNLCSRVNNGYTDLGYGGLKTAYTTTDVRSDGKLYDIYSDHTNYTPGSAYASSYDDVGDGYNREHTIPKSWWGGAEEKQGSDIIIVLPSDAKANGMRSNYPYGETINGTEYKLSSDPSGNRLGTSTSTSYVTGTVFEPFDSRKGDLARTYFYAAAKYWLTGADNGSVKNWTSGDGSKVFSSSGNNGFVQKYLNMLLKWHTEDPVSQWEITRNNNVENVQGNRNPFIDHPSWVDLIWGGTYTSSGLNYENTNGGTATVVNGQISGGSQSASLSLDKSSGTISVGGTLSLTATASGGSGSVTWSITSGSSYASLDTTTGNSVTVTGVAAGNATVTASYSGASASCSVTVTSSGGSGGSGGTLTIAVSDIPTTYNSTSGNTTVGNYTYTVSNVGSSYTSGAMQWKKSVGYIENTTAISGLQSLTIATFTGKTFTGTLYYGTSASPSTNSQSVSNGNTYTIGGSYFKLAVNSSTGYCGDITISYGSSTKTLSSISVSTAPTKTTYTAGECFNPTGLVIQRNYSDSTHDTYTYANHTSEFTFSPTTSTALTTSNTSVTITYGGKSCTQAITVNQPAATSISASANKTFYVGETITSADITVKDNNNYTVNSFTFANEGYQFTYSDASSGGSLTNKTFTNAISGSNKICSLTVQVQRKAYVTPSTVKDTITASMLSATSTQYTNFSGVTATSDAVYAGNNAKDNSGNIQMRSSNSNSGIVSTTSGGAVKSVKITVASGSNTINVYGKNSAYSSASDLYNNSNQGTLVGTTSSTGIVSFTTGYTYLGIRSASGAVYVSSIEITYGSSETPSNVANYIMYADTTNQCISKLDNAISYLGNLSSSDRNTFATSNDYIISTARERLNAWATSQGKTIDYTNATMSNRGGVALLDNNGNNNAIALIISISLLGATSIGICFYLRKKREN